MPGGVLAISAVSTHASRTPSHPRRPRQPRAAHPGAVRAHTYRPGRHTMRVRSRWLTAVALTVALTGIGTTTAAVPAAAESNGGVRVMPLGDSITEGTQVPGGYRIGLWQRLAAGGYRVDYVGSQFNGPAGLADHDHEGHPGWRIDQIDANIVGWLNA